MNTGHWIKKLSSTSRRGIFGENERYSGEMMAIS